MLLFIVVGIADSVYLTAVHYSALPLYCPQAAKVNCAQVIQSPLSEVGGIPISIGGIVWFAVFGILVFALPKLKVARNIWYIFALAAISYSLIGQGILGEICEYCLLLDLVLALSVIVGLKYGASVFRA